MITQNQIFSLLSITDVKPRHFAPFIELVKALYECPESHKLSLEIWTWNLCSSVQIHSSTSWKPCQMKREIESTPASSICAGSCVSWGFDILSVLRDTHRAIGQRAPMATRDIESLVPLPALRSPAKFDHLHSCSSLSVLCALKKILCLTLVKDEAYLTGCCHRCPCLGYLPQIWSWRPQLSDIIHTFRMCKFEALGRSFTSFLYDRTCFAASFHTWSQLVSMDADLSFRTFTFKRFFKPLRLEIPAYVIIWDVHETWWKYFQVEGVATIVFPTLQKFTTARKAQLLTMCQRTSNHIVVESRFRLLRDSTKLISRAL
jgi:hypothetical protein